MHTTRNSSWGICHSACWDTPLGLGLDTPGHGPGHPSPVVGLDTPQTDPQPPPLGLGLDTPRARHPNLPLDMDLDTHIPPPCEHNETVQYSTVQTSINKDEVVLLSVSLGSVLLGSYVGYLFIENTLTFPFVYIFYLC